MSLPPESFTLTAHCLLRLTTALAMEAKDLAHPFPTATGELNRRTGRCYPAWKWLEILEPYYQERFEPGSRSD